ncbi:hypothetical protein [Chitinophaga arvensicola]|uniref:Uncharacterized protein n=1 Tax=Chitinophaga arvensicola TaxID=29529 RepID=A0A1I0Q8N6_9BACT|nr:hypothetical protein [Chitinophaga arvensicola]SEW23368.1 hypothetical protein SAMN04488122_1303 [Chitinophaga arvensicola]
MDFRFKLYRVTTAIALMISGFFAFMGLSVILFQGMNIAFLTSLILWGACFIHSVLSLYLQRSIILPEVPLKENTPGGIQIMGVIALLFSAIMVLLGLVLISLPENIVKEVREMMVNPEEQKAITAASLRFIGAFCLLPGIVLITNVVLSFRFLRQWRQQQASPHNDEEEE